MTDPPIDDSGEEPVLDVRSCGRSTAILEKSFVPVEELEQTSNHDFCSRRQPINELPIAKRVYELPEKLPVTRIVNGRNAEKGEWPWAVVLGKPGNPKFRVICGGTLISSKHVLTAAHCFPGGDSNPNKARLGELDIGDATETEHFDRDLCKVTVHPDYAVNAQGVFNDVAIVTLCGAPIALEDPDAEVQPACLPESGNVGRFSGDFTVIGWGATQDFGPTVDWLQKAKVEPRPLNECKTAYASLHNGVVINDDHICAGTGNTDTCSGDSGGPLLEFDTQEQRW